MTITAMKHDKDPGKELREAVGDVSGIDLFANKVLCAIYVRPTTTKGGIILTDKTRDEDRYQGKVGYVLKMGPSAFVDSDEGRWFGSVSVAPGDWVGFRVSDGLPLRVNGIDCRLIEDTRVQCKLAHPDIIW